MKRQFLLANIFGLGRMVMFSLWGIAAIILVGVKAPSGQNPEAYQRIKRRRTTQIGRRQAQRNARYRYRRKV